MAGLNRLGRQQANIPEPVVVGTIPGILLLMDRWVITDGMDIIDTPMADAIPSTAATPSGGTPIAGQVTLLTTEPVSKNKKKKKKGKS